MTRTNTAIFLALFLSLTTPLFAGGQSEAPTGELAYPLSMVATTGMIGDIVAHVAGDLGVVQTLMGSEVDPHLYRPTRADVARLQSADIIFYNGLMLEGRMGDTLVQIARTRRVYAVTELIDQGDLLENSEYEEAWDPHLWMNSPVDGGR